MEGSGICQIYCRQIISGEQLCLVSSTIRSKNSVYLDDRLWMLSESIDKLFKLDILLQKAVGSIYSVRKSDRVYGVSEKSKSKGRFDWSEGEVKEEIKSKLLLLTRLSRSKPRSIIHQGQRSPHHSSPGGPVSNQVPRASTSRTPPHNETIRRLM